MSSARTPRDRHCADRDRFETRRSACRWCGVPAQPEGNPSVVDDRGVHDSARDRSAHLRWCGPWSGTGATSRAAGSRQGHKRVRERMREANSARRAGRGSGVGRVPVTPTWSARRQSIVIRTGSTPVDLLGRRSAASTSRPSCPDAAAVAGRARAQDRFERPANGLDRFDRRTSGDPRAWGCRPVARAARAAWRPRSVGHA